MKFWQAPWAAAKEAVSKGEKHPKLAKEELAKELVARYHSEDAAQGACQNFNAVHAGGGFPEDAPSLTVATGEASAPVAFLEAAALVKSRAEAKRAVKEGALVINGAKCADATDSLPPGAYQCRLGKKRFLQLTVTP